MEKKQIKVENLMLDDNKIKDILLNNYGIKPIRIKEINRGTANIFKIEAYNKSYVLKEFSEGRTKDSVIKETKIISFLNEKNIKVPIYIKSNTDKFYIEYKSRIIILQEYIDGYTMENNTGDYNKTIESAQILGKMTKALKEYSELSEEDIMRKSFSKESIKNGIVKMKKLQQQLSDNNLYKERFFKDLDDKIKISEDLEKNFDFEIINKMTIMNSHGDYSVQQLIYNENAETTVIDFEKAKRLPIVWEIMRSYSYIDKDAKNGTINIGTLVEYFKEFSKYVKLNEYDLKYAPYIYLIQIISSVFGYKQYNENVQRQSLLQFAFFRTNLCRYLYGHLDEISCSLENNVKINKK